MRIPSATGIVLAAALTAGCATAGPRPLEHPELQNQLGQLGVEGRTYHIDLADTQSIHLHDVHLMGQDLVVEDIHGHLTCLDATTLMPRWDYYGMPTHFDERPSVTPSDIVGVAGGKLFVIARHNGTIMGDPVRVDAVLSARPVATSSTLYAPVYAAARGDDKLITVSLGSGFQGWGFYSDDAIVADMAKGGTGDSALIYAATSAGALVAYPANLASQPKPEPAWIGHAAAPVRRDLVVNGDDLGVVTSDGRLICMDRITGRPRWEAYPSSGELAGSSAQFSDTHVFYVCGGELRAFDRATGRKAWALEGATEYAATRGDRVIVRMGNGGLYMAVDAESGETVGMANLGDAHIVPQATVDATVYTVGAQGLIMAVESGF